MLLLLPIIVFAQLANGYVIDDDAPFECRGSSGSPCVLPFAHEGVTYQRCISPERNGEMKCPLAVDGDRAAKTWQECDTGTCRLACASKFNKKCVFPFNHNDRVHRRCTRDGTESFWCATKVDAEGNVVEKEDCNMDSCPLD